MLTLCINFSVQAQVVANDDVSNPVNGIDGGFAVYVLSNDSFNGGPANMNNTTVTQVSSTNAGISISQWGQITILQGTPAGTYTLVYQLCELANPGNCDTATATINVCDLPAPTIDLPSCSSVDTSLTIHGLPAGNWVLKRYIAWNNIVSIPGSGSSYTVTGLPVGGHVFTVTDASGCTSPQFFQALGYFNHALDYNITGSYVDFNNDGLINVGDTIEYQFTFTNLLSCPVENLVLDNSELIFSGIPLATLPGNGIDNSISATYVLNQYDINSGTVYGFLNLSASSGGSSIGDKLFLPEITLGISDGIALNLFVDTNNNGVMDGSEHPENLGSFEVTLNDLTTVVSHYYSNDGTCTIYETNPLNSYDLSALLSGYACNQQYVLANTSYNNVTVPAGSGITTYNFPVTTSPCADLAVYVYSNNPRPGFTYKAYIYYVNFGNTTIPSGTVTFNPDDLTPIVSISQNGTVANGDGFTYNFTNLLPLQWKTIIVEMQVPNMPTVNIGDPITNNVAITIPANDNYPENNTFSSTRLASNSLDPNDITESHGPQIVHSTFTANDYLTYTIRFENTGNAPAINVRVNDILDSKLDETSIRVLHSSHDYVMQRIGNEVNWKFDGIGLPPSEPNTEIGKGYITFQIKPKPGYAIGDVIPATASIYFDSNPAIVTNTFNTTFVTALGAPEFTQNNIRVYPNPAKSIVNISLDEGIIDHITVVDISGKRVLFEMPNAISASLDISALAKGMYFVKINSSDKEKTVKIIKE